MAIIPNGGSFDLPIHKFAYLTLDGASGIADGATLATSDPDVAGVRIEANNEYNVLPVSKGSATLTATADGDVGPGSLPLTWSATVNVVETVALSLAVTLHVQGETVQRLPTIGSAADIPLNRTAQLRIVAYGATGEEVTLDPGSIVWESGSPAKYTLIVDGTNPQHGNLTPLLEFANVPWSFTAAVDSTAPAGATIEAAGSISITSDASLALAVEVEVL